MLYYCIPVLSGILPPQCHAHLELLVSSMHILLSDSISPSDLQLADQMLQEYNRDFDGTYVYLC